MKFLKLTTAAAVIGAGLISTRKKESWSQLHSDRFKLLFGKPLHAEPFPTDKPKDIQKRLANEKSRTTAKVPEKALMERHYELTKFGVPCAEHDEIVNTYRQFMMEYDPQKRAARWVLEHITKEDALAYDRKAKIEWKPDGNYKWVQRPSEDEWKYYNEYDVTLMRRPLANPHHYNNNDDGYRDCMYTSNSILVPVQMEPILDEVDAYVRSIAGTAKQTWIVTGPLYHDEMTNKADYRVFGNKEWGSRQVAVPIAVFKIVISETDDGYLHLYSFLVPSSESALLDRPATAFLSNIDKVKQLAAIDEFPNIPMTEIATVNNNTNAVWIGADCDPL